MLTRLQRVLKFDNSVSPLCSGKIDARQICSEAAVARRAHIQHTIVTPFITAAKVQLQKRSESTAPSEAGPPPPDVITSAGSDTGEAGAESDTALESDSAEPEGEPPVADSKDDAEDTEALPEAQLAAAEAEVESPHGPTEGKEQADQALQPETAEQQVADPDSTLPHENSILPHEESVLPHEHAVTKGSPLSVRAWVLVGQVIIASFLTHVGHFGPFGSSMQYPHLYTC